ncbi:MAG: ABC transporter substrate-binding protein [Ignisphaera sp.]
MSKEGLIPIFAISLLLLNVALGVVAPLTAQAVPRGPWIDEVVFLEEAEAAKAVERLLAGDIHVYFDDIGDPELFKTVRERGLAYDISYGLYYEITLNPVGPEFPKPQREDVIFNPFSNPKIREALNYIIDREYVANEILGGLAIPRFTAITPSFPDYARYADLVMEIENEYRYNFEKGKSIIYEEMVKMGAEMREGIWYYKDKPVKLIFLIRVEDARRAIGDYVASQLEKIGFIVERVYGKSADLAPLWLRGDPAEGRWHLYTGGWITTVISRDDADNFGYFYTKLGRPEPLWQAYVNDPEFYVVAERLWNRDYKSITERDELMRKALWLSMKESQRIWVVHLTSIWVRRPELELAADLAGGYSGSWLWPYTIRFSNKIGGTVKVGIPSIMTQPWNPIGGSNWIFDQTIIRATGEAAVLPDPYTGLYHPLRVKKAEVYVSKDLEGQIRASLPWVSLEYVDEITVPTDAWWKFNSTTNTIETVPPGTKAKVKVVVQYQDDLFKNYRWHDGSTFDLADIVYMFLLTFDRANPASPLYDEAYIPSFQAFMQVFKGFRIVKEDPLVIEYYTDTWYMDAEWIAATAANAFWPYYSQGPGPWHVVAVAARAEAEGRLAFTADKSGKLNVEWMNLIAGPSLTILAETLDKCIQDGYIPYQPVLGRYLTRDEAVTRYQNLKTWYQNYRHFWVGNGPFFLKSVDVTAKIITLAAYREYIDTAERWAIFSKPPVAVISIKVPDTIYPGTKAEIPIEVTVDGKPYEVTYIDYVKYVISHAGGSLTGYARCIADGKCVIELDGTQTALIVPGPAKVTVIAVSKLVGIPTIASSVLRVSTVIDYVALQLAKTEADLSAKISRLESTLTDKLLAQEETINALRSEIHSLRTMLYISIGVAVVAIVVSIALGLLLKRGSVAGH